MLDHSFSLERALRVTSPAPPAMSHDGLEFRKARIIPLQDSYTTAEFEECRSLRTSFIPDICARLPSMDMMVLTGASYAVVDAVCGLSLSYVLRHSYGGLRWRDGWGRSAQLQPGDLFVNQGSQESLVELSPSVRGEPCECVRMLIRSDQANDLARCLTVDDFSFCNSNDACARVMLGKHHDHLGGASPMPGLKLIDMDIAPYADTELWIERENWAMALLTTGSLQFEGQVLEAPCALGFAGFNPLVRLATQSGASLIWLEIPYKCRMT